MSRPGRVLVVGDVINDVVVRPLGPVASGTDTPSDVRRTFGGQGGNQAAWLAFLGVEVRFAGRAGAGDADAHRQSLEPLGVDVHLTGDPSHETGSIVVVVDASGERSMFTDRGAGARLAPADLPLALLDGVTHLHLSGYVLFEEESRQATLALAAEARRLGLPVSLDPASVAGLSRAGRDRFLGWAEGVELLFPNLDEGCLLAGHETPDRVLPALLARFQEVALKLGPGGALCGTAGGARARVPAVGASVLDSTGAGDAFAAGYLAARLAGRSLEERVEAAVSAAGLALGAFGGRPPGS